MRRFHQSYLVVFFSVGVIAGMILGLIFRINYFSSPIFLGVVLGLFLLGYFRPNVVFLVLMVVAGMILAFFRVAGELEGENYVRQFYGQEVLVLGTVKGDPETDEKGTKVKLEGLEFGEEGRRARGSVYVTLRKNTEILRGDRIKIFGKIEEGFGTYAGYFYQPRVEAIYRAEPRDFIVTIRDWFSERVRGGIDGSKVQLGLSYLLGMKTGLEAEFEEDLRTVGLTHIVVASGAHLSILVEIARKIFGRISRFSGLLFSILFIVFFMAMVGFTPSILRAGVMAILTIATWFVGRKMAAWRMILIVMAGTLLINPMFLIDLGWLLSFASFMGIMILGPRMAKFFYGEKEPGFIAGTIITTIAATVMTLPITLYYFGTVSLISVVANLLILPTLPYAMGLVFLTGVLNGVPGIFEVISFLAEKMLDFHIMVVEFFGEMESFLITIPIEDPRVFLIYGGILGVLGFSVWTKTRKNGKIKRSRNNNFLE